MPSLSVQDAAPTRQRAHHGGAGAMGWFQRVVQHRIGDVVPVPIQRPKAGPTLDTPTVKG
jgi:hypothetical protein